MNYNWIIGAFRRSVIYNKTKIIEISKEIGGDVLMKKQEEEVVKEVWFKGRRLLVFVNWPVTSVLELILEIFLFAKTERNWSESMQCIKVKITYDLYDYKLTQNVKTNCRKDLSKAKKLKRLWKWGLKICYKIVNND